MGKQQATTSADAVREAVSSIYGKLVAGELKGCCSDPAAGPSCSAHAEAIGYGQDDLSRLTGGVEAPTFGCGNPLAFAEVQEGETVVDLGSGAGLDLLIAAERVGPSGHVIGVDMTDEMIDRARRNVAAAGHVNVEVRKGLIEDLPVETGTVDWVISNCVINLSPEKDRVFAEIARVLRPGGRMLISDMVAQDLPAWVRESAAALGACVGGAISEAEYLAGLREAGLADVEVRQRHVYSAEELCGFVEMSDCGCSANTETRCCGSSDEPPTQQLAEALDGKVASIQVLGRKPAG
jgi:SAM-dependent methyltransferase